jgi:hypothetical protein
MHRTFTRWATLSLLLGAAALPALAASSASSASSDAASTSVGSVSTSFEKSSDSSSKGNKAAMGDYRIVNVAAAEQRPGTMRGCSCNPSPSRVLAGALVLYVPRATHEQNQLAAGQVITATPRPYGTEFARAEKPFFLVLHDAWFDELQTRPVTL